VTAHHEVIAEALKGLKEDKALSACSIDIDVDPQSMI